MVLDDEAKYLGVILDFGTIILKKGPLFHQWKNMGLYPKVIYWILTAIVRPIFKDIYGVTSL